MWLLAMLLINWSEKLDVLQLTGPRCHWVVKPQLIPLADGASYNHVVLRYLDLEGLSPIVATMDSVHLINIPFLKVIPILIDDIFALIHQLLLFLHVENLGNWCLRSLHSLGSCCGLPSWWSGLSSRRSWLGGLLLLLNRFNTVLCSFHIWLSLAISFISLDTDRGRSALRRWRRGWALSYRLTVLW